MLDNLTEKFFPGKKRKKKRHAPIKDYHIPHGDGTGQWWYGYEKVYLVRHPEWTKDFYEYRKRRIDSVD
jgi:hypothetical protein